MGSRERIHHSAGWIARTCSATRMGRASPSPSSIRASTAIIPPSGGRVVRHLRVDLDGEEAIVVDDPDALDPVGHGTACAGIVAGIAPGASLVSIRMLGADNRGKGRALAAAVDWTIARASPS